jgi:hypothetical protein
LARGDTWLEGIFKHFSSNNLTNQAHIHWCKENIQVRLIADQMMVTGIMEENEEKNFFNVKNAFI